MDLPGHGEGKSGFYVMSVVPSAQRAGISESCCCTLYPVPLSMLCLLVFKAIFETFVGVTENSTEDLQHRK